MSRPVAPTAHAKPLHVMSISWLAVVALLVGILMVPPEPADASHLAGAVSHESTGCFQVETSLRGQKYVPLSSLAPGDRGFEWVNTRFRYNVRLQGREYKLTYSDGSWQWHFEPSRFAIGGNGTVAGGGQTLATSGENPPNAALGSLTAYSFHRKTTDFEFGLGYPWSASVSWNSNKTIRTITNKTWSAGGTAKTSGTLVWQAPLTGRVSGGLTKITVSSAPSPGGDGPTYWTSAAEWNRRNVYRSSVDRSYAAFSGLSRVTCGSVNWSNGPDRSVDKPDTPDTTAPTLDKPIASLTSPTSRTANYSLTASDDRAVTHMRVRATPETAWRPWVAYAGTGTVWLPDRYGDFTIWFQVKDAAGNVSSVRATDVVTRRIPVSLALQQIDNNGNVRSCGATEATPCSDVVKKFRATIDSPVLPDTDLLLSAWRYVDGSWVETTASPFKRLTITGRVIDIPISENLMDGLWRFRAQVPRDTDGLTEYAASAYQYLRIDTPDTTSPTITTASLAHPDPASQHVSFSLSASDNASAVTQMRVFVNGAERPWVAYASSGTVVLPDGYGTFGIGFQVMDAAGNASSVHFAGAVNRRAAVALTLNQVDNNGNVRSCGSDETAPCSDVVKKFRTVINSPVSPSTNLLLKAWRKIDGSWIETSTSPFMYEAISGRSVITMEVTANLLKGIWRFQSQVPVTDATQFSASNYQYLRLD